MFKKLKSLLADDAIYLSGLLILVGIASFGLGRLSAGGESTQSPQTAAVGLTTQSNALKKAETTEKTVSETNETRASSTTTVAINKGTAPFVASKSGSKYHKITCPGAKQIKDTNKIYFMSEDEAKASGYERASNCKGW